MVEMLRAFVDESGTDPTGPAFVMGSFLSSAIEWEKASDAWDIALGEYPPLKAFHHSDAQSLTGEFLGWDRDAADAKVIHLARTIARFDLQGCVTCVSHSWFGPRHKRAAKGMFGTRIYDHAFVRMVSGIGHYVDEAVPGDDKVDFIHRRRELKQCLIAYEDMRESEPEWMTRCGTCVPEDDTTVALQMADLLSWEFLKVVERETQSEAFKIINDAHPVIYFPCTPPQWFPFFLALQGFGQTVKDVADHLQIRKFRDHEKTPEFLQDVDRLISEKIEFDQYFMLFCKMTGHEKELANYMQMNKELWEKMGKFRDV